MFSVCNWEIRRTTTHIDWHMFWLKPANFYEKWLHSILYSANMHLGFCWWAAIIGMRYFDKKFGQYYRDEEPWARSVTACHLLLEPRSNTSKILLRSCRRFLSKQKYCEWQTRAKIFWEPTIKQLTISKDEPWRTGGRWGKITLGLGRRLVAGTDCVSWEAIDGGTKAKQR